MAHFKPRTEEELALDALLPRGIYHGQVVTAEQQESKRGDAMIKLRVDVFDGNGGRQVVFDYVADAWMPHKLRHVCESAGALDAYQTGDMGKIADLLGGRDVWLELDQEEGKGGYPPKNVVRDYMTRDKANAVRVAESDGEAPPDDDDLPF